MWELVPALAAANAPACNRRILQSWSQVPTVRRVNEGRELLPGVGRVSEPVKGAGVGRPVHYYDENYPTDHEDAPLCKLGRVGDSMTFFPEDTTCPRCKAAFR